jgi:hypothetical protein
VRIRFLHAVNLVIDSWHPAAKSENVLRIVGTNRIVDAAALREDPEAKIITDDPETVCRVIGIPFPDRQVTEG